MAFVKDAHKDNLHKLFSRYLIFVRQSYHLIKAPAQVKPLPNAHRQIRSPSFILPASQASHRAMGTDAAVEIGRAHV